MTVIGDMDYHCTNCGSHSLIINQTGSFNWGLGILGLLVGSFLLAPILFFIIGPFVMFVPLLTAFMWGKAGTNRVTFKCLGCGNSGYIQ